MVEIAYNSRVVQAANFARIQLHAIVEHFNEYSAPDRVLQTTIPAIAKILKSNGFCASSFETYSNLANRTQREMHVIDKAAPFVQKTVTESSGYGMGVLSPYLMQAFKELKCCFFIIYSELGDATPTRIRAIIDHVEEGDLPGEAKGALAPKTKVFLSGRYAAYRPPDYPFG